MSEEFHTAMIGSEMPSLCCLYREIAEFDKGEVCLHEIFGNCFSGITYGNKSVWVQDPV